MLGGYVTKDPYILGQLDPKAQIRTALVAEAGYPNYRTTVTIRGKDRSKLDKCLQRRVPIMQRAHVAFMANPESQIRLVAGLDAAYKTTYPYTEQTARFGYEELRRLGIVFNGRDGKIGDFDLKPKGRIDRMLTTLVPVYEGRDLHLPPLKPTDLATNDYLAPIGLPSDR